MFILRSLSNYKSFIHKIYLEALGNILRSFSFINNYMYDEKTDRYIPTQSERRAFGRVSNNYNPSSNKVHRELLKQLYNISNHLSERSRKLFYDIIWDCYAEKYSVPSVCYSYVLSRLSDKFYPSEIELIRKKIEELKNK